ncbi:dTDP-4-dehydrorhamnose 3,5-epimerase family protein [bacterium]|nr:dTDP-4-dehydrorhamnose 3,5-epimerase family protein [bacterium]
MKYVKKIKHHEIQGVIEIVLDPFYDDRGEIWSIYEECEILPNFLEDKISISNRNTLRGLHGDKKTGKLISCLHGELFLAVVDFREKSSTFLKKICFNLSDNNPRLIYVPPGCLNGHLSLSDKCIFFYKWTQKYTSPEEQITIKWSDPTLNIPWPIKNPKLSTRDQQGLIL